MKKRIIMISLFLAFFAAVCFSCGGGGSTSVPQVSYGSIAVYANISGASVYMDGNYKGTIPTSKTLTLTGISTGGHTIKLTLSGYQDQQKTVTVRSNQIVSASFTLQQANSAPIADAGTDQRGFGGFYYSHDGWNGSTNVFTSHSISFTLDATGSTDSNGDDLIYSWIQTDGPSVTLSSASASRTTFIPTQAATYTFQVTVGDGSFSDSDTVNVRVEYVSGKIVFSSTADQVDNDIYSMNADGSDLIQLTVNDIDESWPAWSPDGGTIAYNDHGDNWGIYLMNPDGTNQRPLSTPRLNAGTPHYSPDGTRFAVAGSDGQIHVIDLSDNSMTKITNLSVNYMGPNCWLPDNQTIIFSGEYSLGSYNWELMSVKADGSDLKRLTNNAFDDDNANATPDGRLIYVWQDIQYGGPFGHKKLYLMNADGTGNTLIGDEDHGYQYPVMTSDGNYIFYSDESGYIHVMTSDGSLDQNLGIWGKELDYTPH